MVTIQIIKRKKVEKSPETAPGAAGEREALPDKPGRANY